MSTKYANETAVAQAIRAHLSGHNTILDPLIARGAARSAGARRLEMYSGGFALVFPIDVPAEGTWAFRVWTSDPGDLGDFYKRLQTKLRQLDSDYFAEIHYLDEGIEVEGVKLPTIRMPWLDGKSYKAYLIEHLSDKERLRHLADSFLELCRYMWSNDIVHGDLQHDNIRVDSQGRLKLIDYDSLAIKEHKPDKLLTHGKPGFQHPLRSATTAHGGVSQSFRELDYFSQLIIYLSTVALIDKPELAELCELEESETLLFSHQSLQSIDALHQSAIYKEMSQMEGDIPLLLNLLGVYLQETDLRRLCHYGDWMNKKSPNPVLPRPNPVGGKKMFVGIPIDLCWEQDTSNLLALSFNGVEVADPGERSYRLPGIEHPGTFSLEVVSRGRWSSKTCTYSYEIHESPQIRFEASKTLLKPEETEPVELSWEVADGCKVYWLEADGSHTDLEQQGICQVCPKDRDNEYSIVVVHEDGYAEFVRSVSIAIRPEAQVQFSSEKEYVMPNTMVKLSWSVSDAIDVQLGEEKVNPVGEKKVRVMEDTEYRLLVEDAHGRRSYGLGIKVLSHPRMEVIKVPAPTLDIEVNIEAYQSAPRIPKVPINSIKIGSGLLNRFKDAYNILMGNYERLKLESDEYLRKDK